MDTKTVFDYSLIKFCSAKYKIDTYQLFTEQGTLLLKLGGLLGYITPNTFLKNIFSEPLRRYILENTIIKEVMLFYYSVFSAASVDTCIFILQKGLAGDQNLIKVSISESISKIKTLTSIYQNSLKSNLRYDFNLLISSLDQIILNKVNKRSLPLKTFCDAYFGIQTFDRDKFVSTQKQSDDYKPVIDGWNIEPYFLKDSQEFVFFNKNAIKSGSNEIVYTKNRICIRQIGFVPIATYVPSKIYTLNTIYNVFLRENIEYNLLYFLGIINSKVIKFYWEKSNSDSKKTFPKIKKDAILNIPIPNINCVNKSYNEIINLVTQLLQLNKEKQEVKLQSRLEQIQSKIDYCENRIDQLVYQLYGLTEEEIKIVENEK